MSKRKKNREREREKEKEKIELIFSIACNTLYSDINHNYSYIIDPPIFKNNFYSPHVESCS